ncbi:hypothetical protein [Microvirga solisilvae]|uniref:hypothetical protein n=1 Tax=Microvirga solisilvae TaxID=2919498 RepID=UPI001FAEDE88|nr:hypothetical protein [Microvirga solisilvae]
MLGALFRTAGIVLFYAIVSGAASWVAADWAPRLIDTCSGPAVDCGFTRGLEAVLVYHPLFWFITFALLLATRKGTLLPVFETRWIYLIAPVIFLAVFAVYFVFFVL